jgi:hypothetical protein
VLRQLLTVHGLLLNGRFMRCSAATGSVDEGKRELWIDGNAVFPDLWFKKENVVVEIDSYAFTGDIGRLPSMTARRHALLVERWTGVIRVTPNMIRDNPELVPTPSGQRLGRHSVVAAARSGKSGL